jgi:hypothetical protein
MSAARKTIHEKKVKSVAVGLAFWRPAANIPLTGVPCQSRAARMVGRHEADKWHGISMFFGGISTDERI